MKEFGQQHFEDSDNNATFKKGVKKVARIAALGGAMLGAYKAPEIKDAVLGVRQKIEQQAKETRGQHTGMATIKNITYKDRGLYNDIDANPLSSNNLLGSKEILLELEVEGHKAIMRIGPDQAKKFKEGDVLRVTYNKVQGSDKGTSIEVKKID